MGLVPCSLTSLLTVRSIIFRTGLIASLFAFFSQIQASIILKKASKINAVMKRKNSNCVVILTDQGKLKLLQTLVNTFFLIDCPQGTKQRLGYHNKILCKTKEDKCITGQMKNYSADLPDVQQKPGV